jgi:hypothetical protein
VGRLRNEVFGGRFEDIRSIYLPALRHCLFLSFEAYAEIIATYVMLMQILNEVKKHSRR